MTSAAQLKSHDAVDLGDLPGECWFSSAVAVKGLMGETFGGVWCLLSFYVNLAARSSDNAEL